MMQSRIPGYALLGVLLVATPALARVRISEVMWMGSDQSTADEWVEVVGVDDGGTVFPLSLSGWTLTSLGTDGIEKTIVRFGNIAIDASQYLVVSNYPASQSRLATDPVLTTTAMTLPNTKLLLWLRDASGTIIDEVDDGVGVPFAGANPSGTGAKASMERMDLLVAGNVKENWQTVTATVGFDPGPPIFGTPGFPRAVASSSSTSSSISSVSLAPQSSSSASDVGSVSLAPQSSSSASDVGSVSPVSSSSLSSVEGRSSSQTSEVGSSCPQTAHDARIAIQSGDTRGEGKVTVNLQVRWEGKGSLQCQWDYGDGFTSMSCNPPSHTFTVPGQYDVRLDTEDACGGSGKQTLPVEVLAMGKAEGPWRTGSQSSTTPLKYARVIRVIDGDTVEVMEEGGKLEVIRLLGIDAPERSQGYVTEEWGKAAQEVLRGLLDGAVIELTFDEVRSDVYGRTLAYLSIRGHDIGAELLRQGLAEVYRKCRCVRKEEYFRLEDEARERGVGMWGEGGTTGNVGMVGKVGQVGVGTVGANEEEGKDKEDGKREKTAVFLSEVYPVPLPAEEEWVELWNGAEEPLDLSGWMLDDVEGGGSRAWEFPERFILQPGAFIVLRSDQTHLAFNNEGDSVALIDPDGKIVDRMVYEKLRRGHAFARIIQRIGSTGEFRATDRFCVTDHPTPFERNMCEGELLQDEKSRRACTPECGVPARRRVMVKGHASPIGRHGDTSNVAVPPRARRVVRLARRVRYRNILPPSASGELIVTPDPTFAALLAHMERSVQHGQVVWREEDVPLGKGKMIEWEAMLLPFFLVMGAHWILTGMRRSAIL